MNPEELESGVEYICKDFGIVSYSRTMGRWALFLLLERNDLEVAYSEEDVVKSIRKITKLDRLLREVDE